MKKKSLHLIIISFCVFMFINKTYAQLDILYVAGQSAPYTEDTIVYDSLIAWGHNVTFTSGNSINSNWNDTVGKDLILETRLGSFQRSYFKRNFSMPMIFTDSPDEFGLSYSNITVKADSVYLQGSNAGHPLMKGFEQGGIKFYANDNRTSTQVLEPHADADGFMFLLDNDGDYPDYNMTLPTVVYYEKGDNLAIDGDEGDLSAVSHGKRMYMRINTESIDPANRPSQDWPGPTFKLLQNAIEFMTAPDTTIFTNSVDVNWTTVGNWSNGIPNSTVHAEIATDQEVNIATAASCLNLVIKPGAVVTIASANSLTVENNVLLESPLSNAPTGQLLDFGTLTLNGTFSMQRYLPTNSTTNNWRYISSPVNTVQASDLDIGSAGTHLFTWNETGDTWQEITTGGTLLTPGFGYAYGVNAETTLTLSGSPNTGDLPISGLSNTVGGTYAGYHLLGNPYPSAVNADNLSTTNLSDDIWYRTNGTFQTYNLSTKVGVNGGTSIIPAMQSFWISVQSGTTGSLTFSNASRAGNTTTSFKSSSTGSLIRLEIKANELTDEMAIGFYDGAGTGVDLFDSKKMFAESNKYPQIFSIVDNKELAINNYPDANTKVIPIGIRTNKASTYEIKLSRFEGVDKEKIGVILTDAVENKSIHLKEGETYSFNINTDGQIVDRFTLIVNPSNTENLISGVDHETRDIEVYSSNGRLFLKSSSMIEGVTRVEVFNTMGQKIQYTDINNLSGVMEIKLGEKTGYLILRVSNKDYVNIQKMISIQ